MKKFKNNEIKKNSTLLEHVEKGKIQKKKQKDVKKLKNEVGEVADAELAQKESGSNRKFKKKDKEISAKLEENQQFKKKDQKVAKNPSKTGKPTNQPKSKILGENLQTEPSTKELEKFDVKKIEKKKAKKLGKQIKKKENAVNEDSLNKTTDTKTNGLLNNMKLDTSATKSSNSAIGKVLAKKEKKAEKRRLMQAQKLAEKQKRDPAAEASTLFVGNLPVNTKRVQIVTLFKDFAPVRYIRIRSAGGKVIFKHKARKNAGSLNAYVVFKDQETAQKAVSLNGVEFKGNHLRITLSMKNSPSDEKEENKRTVFVGNLKYSATEESLREIFSSCGEIDYVRCLQDGDKGCKGVAYVRFKSSDAVGLALELNKTIVDERPINVERYSNKKLGAKAARDAIAEKEKKSKMGAKQRIDDKKGKNENLEHMREKNYHSEPDDDKKAKKSEFRGVKVESLKKKQKSKKKKSNDQMLQLAKKIAPKLKTG